MESFFASRRSADFQICCVAGFPARKPFAFANFADLEVGDTAGLETCATRVVTALLSTHLQVDDRA
jgi:hypothetical protein